MRVVIFFALIACGSPSSAGDDDDAPGMLQAPVVTATTTRTTVTLAWQTDGVAVGYDIYQDGNLIATAPPTSYTGTGFDCADPYNYAVDAFDAAGNHTAQVPVSGATLGCLSSWDDVVDFFIQDVCLDSDGVVIQGVSPIDGNPACVTHRDLTVGENLPYHKTEVDDDKLIDEFPVDSGNPAVGVFPMKVKGKTTSLEVGDGPANIYLRSDKTIASYSTIDANGPTYHIGVNCSGGVPMVPSMFDTQIRVDIDALSANYGDATVYAQRFSKVYNPSPTCPDPDDVTNDTPNRWWFADYPFQLSNGQMSEPLETLVSHTDPNTTDHIEISYQTRELGRTRFEAWQNVAGHDADYVMSYQKMHDAMVASGKCMPLVLAPPPTTVDGQWIEYACGPYSGITPATDTVNGDSPQMWIDMAKASNMDAPIFNLTTTDYPTIASISPSTIDFGYTGPITITGTGYGNSFFGTQNIVMFNGGNPHFVVDSTNGATQIVFSFDQNTWDGSRKDHSINCGRQPVRVFDGISMSDPYTFKIQNCPQD